MSETPNLTIELLLFLADLFMDSEKRPDHGSERMILVNQFEDLSPELRPIDRPNCSPYSFSIERTWFSRSRRIATSLERETRRDRVA